jgi:hypothetical protein
VPFAHQGDNRQLDYITLADDNLFNVVHYRFSCGLRRFRPVAHLTSVSLRGKLRENAGFCSFILAQTSKSLRVCGDGRFVMVRKAPFLQGLTCMRYN